MSAELNKTQNFIANFISKIIIFFVGIIFRHNKTLQNNFKEFREAEEELKNTWDQVCEERKGTNLDCDVLDQMSRNMDAKLNIKPYESKK
jgi:hypothetical protein